MGKHERRAYLVAIRGRYRKANRAGKARILDEFCAVCGYHRKYAIRLLRRKKPVSTSRRVGRKPRYDRRHATQRFLRSFLVVFSPPSLDHHLGMW